jgi:hypothetical protein
MKSKACVTNKKEAIGYTTKLISEDYNVDMICIDFEKEFDKKIIRKISAYRIKGKTLD